MGILSSSKLQSSLKSGIKTWEFRAPPPFNPSVKYGIKVWEFRAPAPSNPCHLVPLLSLCPCHVPLLSHISPSPCPHSVLPVSPSCPSPVPVPILSLFLCPSPVPLSRPVPLSLSCPPSIPAPVPPCPLCPPMSPLSPCPSPVPLLSLSRPPVPLLSLSRPPVRLLSPCPSPVSLPSPCPSLSPRCPVRRGPVPLSCPRCRGVAAVRSPLGAMELPAALAAPLLALPAAFGATALPGLARSPSALALVLLLLLLGLSAILILSGAISHFQDPLFCLFTALSFVSAVDLLIALEEDEIISGFMETYVREGDPQLRTSHGLLSCYWDGTVHLGLYLTMAAACGLRKNYRSLGLFWLGSMLMGALVFLLGNLLGKFSSELGLSFLLQLPYLLLLLWAARRIYLQPRELPSLSPEQVWQEQHKPLLRRPRDVALVVLLLLCAAFTFFRGLVVLDCPADSCFEYGYQREPYLRDPVAYPRVQMLLFLFYLLPFLLLAVLGLILPGCSWLPDCSLLAAGAVAQAQFSHLGSSLHSRTPFPYQTPDDVLGTFLLSNLLFALCPQLLALRCLRAPAFFLPRAAPTARAKKHQ